jgi:hypothetical protein
MSALRAREVFEITTEDGASARVERSPDGAETLALRDRAGRLLFEYDAVTGRGTLLVPDGDLRIAAPKGAIELSAREGVRLDCGSRLEVSAEASELHLGETEAHTLGLAATIERAELRFGELTRTATRVIEQAESVYQRVSDVLETRAGRLRALVRESFWVKSQDVTLLAKDDVHIDGERINLG